MSTKKEQIFVQKQKKIKEVPTLVLVALKEKGSIAEQIAGLIKKGTAHFEVNHANGTKTVYRKESYQQNFNKKLVKA